MAHRIEYYRDNVRIGTIPWGAPLEDTKRIARAAPLWGECDRVRIIDIDRNGVTTEVWSERRDPGRSDVQSAASSDR